jgi:uncharacterized DUF497 family protein
MEYNLEWDPAKTRENFRKHRVGFERAAQVFRDPNILSIEDEEHSEQEDRWVSIGRDESGNLLVVIHTFRETEPQNFTIRIISARKATRREAKQYSMR